MGGVAGKKFINNMDLYRTSVSCLVVCVISLDSYRPLLKPFLIPEVHIGNKVRA